MKSYTKDTDKGRLRILKEMQKLKRKPYVKAGLMGKRLHKASKQTTVVDVGIAHEFGTQHIPQRSFMRTTFDEKHGSWSKETETLKNLIFLGKSTVKKGLKTMGLIITRDIKDKIIRQDPSWPDLKTATITRKKSSKKLIDTAQMLHSIKDETVMRP